MSYARIIIQGRFLKDNVHANFAATIEKLENVTREERDKGAFIRNA